MGVYFYGCISMDGYLADRQHRLDWLYATGSPEETGYEDFYAQMDVTLMGRKTYEEAAKGEDLSKIYPTTENYVFTHRGDISGPGAAAVCGDVADFVRGLGRERNIWVIGGNTLLGPLLDCGLVGHIILQVAPVLLGEGIPLFTQHPAVRRFRLKDVRRYGPFAELHWDRPSGENG